MRTSLLPPRPHEPAAAYGVVLFHRSYRYAFVAEDDAQVWFWYGGRWVKATSRVAARFEERP